MHRTRLFLLFLSVSLRTSAQDFSETVVPISGARPTLQLRGPRIPRPAIEMELGTGFCVDPGCRFIGTNYHIAMLVQPRRIKGEKIIQRYLATGPDDRDATPKLVASKWMAYSVSRDLAIFELRHPLPHSRGAGYMLDDLEPGQQVDIYCYPLEFVHPLRKLIQFHGAFKAKTTSGLLAFDYRQFDGHAIRGGASGGIVVDQKGGRIVGILTEVAKEGESIALAVPVQSLVDFLNTDQPYLAQNLFPAAKPIQPMTADLYPKFVPRPAASLQRRQDDPPEVKVLREKAQALTDNVRDFVAVQSFAWGKGTDEPAAHAQYEIQVIAGVQRFRRYSEDARDFTDVVPPRLTGWTLPADEWASLPKMVGTEYKLKIRAAEDALVNGQRVKVFQYYAGVEDDLCPFEAVEDHLLFTVAKPVAVACYGEVWTDSDFNILRMSENLDLSSKSKEYRGWQAFRVVLTYDWLKQADGVERRVPLTIFTEASDKKHVYWCRGQFTNYSRFTTRSRLVANSVP